jgi:hypothetical protein
MPALISSMISVRSLSRGDLRRGASSFLEMTMLTTVRQFVHERAEEFTPDLETSPPSRHVAQEVAAASEFC